MMGHTVMLVEDNRETAKALSDRLLKEGYVVLNAYDGKQALQIVKERDPDLILLDIMLPFLNGVEVLKHIMQDQERNNIPVIMLSGKSSTNYIDTCLSLGAVDYVTKPFKIVDFMEKVKHFIKTKKPRPPKQEKAVVRPQAALVKNGFSGKRKKLLVVDDNMDAVELLFDRLEMEGFLVDVAYDGEECLRKIGGSVYDLIVLDIMMPEVNGFEVLQKLKEKDVLSSMPVVISSACSTEEDIQKGYDLGAVGYIVKPYKIPDLIDAINKYALK